MRRRERERELTRYTISFTKIDDSHATFLIFVRVFESLDARVFDSLL